MPETLTDADDPDRLIWGAENIARVVNKSTKATAHMLAKGHLPADKVGRQWVSTPRRLKSIANGQAA